MRYIFLWAIFFLSITSCNLGSETEKISGNSFFRNEGKGYRMIFSNAILYKTIIYPDVVSHAYNKDFIIAKQIPEKANWPSLLGFDFYGRYTAYAEYLKDANIFEKSAWKDLKGKIEWDSINYQMFHSRGASDKNSSEDMHISRIVADSLIENDPYYKKIFSSEENYWIIYNPKDTLIGPLTKQEYLAKRKELKIPDDLQLE